MRHKPTGLFGPEPPADPPPAELRERVLGRCRQEIALQFAAHRRSRNRLQWALAAGAAFLLLVNAVEEHRSTTRMAALVVGGPRRGAVVLVAAPRAAPAAIRLFRARATLLAALLRDPNAL